MGLGSRLLMRVRYEMACEIRRCTLIANLATVVVATVSIAQEQPQLGVAAGPSEATDPAAEQLAVEKGLFFVERQSMEWWNRHKCSTRHERGILLVAANVANTHGLPVNQEKLQVWIDNWVLVDGVSHNKKNREIAGRRGLPSWNRASKGAARRANGPPQCVWR